jgi:hypothetical protein
VVASFEVQSRQLPGVSEETHEKLGRYFTPRPPEEMMSTRPRYSARKATKKEKKT